MINSITANELKTKGVTLLDQVIGAENEAIITVRGKSKYVVLSMDEYNHLRECELEAAINETKQDLAEGKFYEGSIDEHISRITDA